MTEIILKYIGPVSSDQLKFVVQTIFTETENFKPKKTQKTVITTTEEIVACIYSNITINQTPFGTLCFIDLIEHEKDKVVVEIGGLRGTLNPNDSIKLTNLENDNPQIQRL